MISSSRNAIALALRLTRFVFALPLLAAAPVTAQALLDFIPEPLTNASFGNVISVDGSSVAVAATSEQVGGNREGAVYIYRRSGTSWLLEERLVAPTVPDVRGFFGGSLDLVGDRLAVGAPDFTTGSIGRVYVYERDASGWSLAETLEQPSLPAGSDFGVNVKLEGSRLFAGSNVPPTITVFREGPSGWINDQRINRPVGAQDFAYRFDADGEYLVATVKNLYVGIEIYREVGATFVRQPTPATPQSYDPIFLLDVAIKGGCIAVGNATEELFGSLRGDAYTYAEVSPGVWGQFEYLSENVAGIGDDFGANVRFGGDFLYVLARDSGKVVRYDSLPSSSSWGVDRVFENPLVPSGSLGASRMDPSGAVLAVSNQSGGSGLVRGVFMLDATGSIGVSYCDPGPNSTGERGQLLVTGSEVALDNDLQLVATGLPTDAFGLFLVGPAVSLSGSTGGICIDGPIGRFLPPFQADAGGGALLDVDLVQLPRPTGPIAVLAGESWTFQAWHRDGPAATQVTNATSVLFR